MSCPDHPTSAAQAESASPSWPVFPVPWSPQCTARSKEFIPVKPSAGSRTSCFHLLQPLTKYPTPHHHDPSFSSLDVLGSSASHFTLARLRAGSRGRPLSCLWQTLQKLFEEPGEKQDSSVPALQGHVAEGCSPSAAPQCLDSHLWLCWAMPEEISFCQPSSQITATRSDQLLRDSTHLMQSFKQAVIVLHWLLFFKLKIAGMCDVSTAQTQGISGWVVLILVPCWDEIATQHHPSGSSASPPSFAFHSTVLVAKPSFLELTSILNIFHS